MGKKLGQADDPLLVSVRSGAKFCMPGMMDTVLNIGLSDASVVGLAAQAGNERFAWDSYRRLIQMFGKTVLGVDGELFEDALEEAKRAKGTDDDLDLDAGDLRDLVEQFKADRRQGDRPRLPAGPARADGPGRPRRLRLLERRARQALPPPGAHPRRPGHGRQHLLDGLRQPGPDSGTGVAFTRDPATGHQGVYGDYLQNAQGEDVVAGIRNTVPLAELEQLDKRSYDQLHADHGDPRDALQGPVRHRVHHRARQAVDAADPGRQAHRRRRLPHRHPAGRPGPDRRGRGAAAGQRRAARRS